MKPHFPRIRRPKFRWIIFHTALVIFACDMIANFWPAFAHVWGGVGHAAVAVATVLACCFDFLSSVDEDEQHHFIRAEIAHALEGKSNASV